MPTRVRLIDPLFDRDLAIDFCFVFRSVRVDLCTRAARIHRVGYRHCALRAAYVLVC